MTRIPPPTDHPLFLGIEGGGTRTVALLADARGNLVQRVETGPGNLKLLTDRQFLRLLQSIATRLPRPDALAIGMAGARGEPDWRRIRTAASRVWPRIPCHATHDLETALAAAEDNKVKSPTTRVLILSGTGSCCYGQSPSGKTVKLGGWGHLLGDRGSGFQIAMRALRSVLAAYDRDGRWPRLGARLLHRLQLNEPDELIDWVQSAQKSDIATLAVEVFAASGSGDNLAAAIISDAQESLARDALACAQRLTRPRSKVHFILAGGTLLKQPQFSRQLRSWLRQLWPRATVSSLERESAWGALALAKKIWNAQSSTKPLRLPLPRQSSPEMPLLISSNLSPTEQRNPRSAHLDKLSLADAIKLMLSEDAKIPKAILSERKNIERAISLIVRAFRRGGRLFYVGAGTSGRLGVLDASECPPTFRVSPDMVQGIIAGGQSALWRSIEGAEDDPAAGARAVGFRGVTRRDVVVGIAASGRTPFVWGALAEAARRGAKTILLNFNPALKIPARIRPALVIAPDVGPEILTGSTRLKAGTATKLVLNMLTTLAMVRLGKVMGNLMVDVNPSNAKLRDRAARIVQELRKVDYATARQALENSTWDIRKACARLAGRKIRDARRS